MFSIRMKLNDVIGKDEQVILENIRRCKQFAGKQFKVIFRNDGLSSKECEEFVKRNEKMLFEIRTQITSINSPFDNCWFLIDSDNSDKCKQRYGFKGGPKTHGQSDRWRAPGSIGAGSSPGRVRKGKKMPGHMGNQRVTVKNLEVISVEGDMNLMFIKAAIPGAPTGLIFVCKRIQRKVTV